VYSTGRQFYSNLVRSRLLMHDPAKTIFHR